MNTLSAVLIAVFSGGGALAITALLKGLNGWRAGAARTEARAISNLEKYRDEADQRAQLAEHRASYYHDVAEYWRDRAGNAEFKIRNKWGPEEVPTPGPIPTYTPLVFAPLALMKATPKADPDE